MGKAESHCPCCSVKIPMRDRRGMISIFGTRKSVPCPHCGKLITYSKSYRIFFIGLWFLFVLACIALPFEVLDICDGIISFIILCIVWLLFFMLGILQFTVKLEISDLEEQNDSQEKTR